MMIGSIAKKEFWDFLRDKRAVIAIVVGPIIGLAMLGGISLMIGGGGAMFTPKYLIINGDAAPGIVEMLSQGGAKITEGTAEDYPEDKISEAVKEGTFGAVIVIPGNFTESIKEHSAKLTVYWNSNEMGSMTARGMASETFSRYGKEVASAELQEQGMDPRLLDPITPEFVNVIPGEGGSDAFSIGGGMMALYIVIYAAVGAQAMVIYTTAQEKENRTLEPLLTTPVSRNVLAWGKFLACFGMGALMIGLVIVIFILGLSHMPGAVYRIGGISAGQIGGVLAVSMLFTAFCIALQITLCVTTKTLKEATARIGWIHVIVMMPAFAAMFLSLNQWYWYLVPILNVALCIKGMTSAMVTPFNLVLALGSSVVYTCGMIWVMAHMFNSEKAWMPS